MTEADAQASAADIVLKRRREKELSSDEAEGPTGPPPKRPKPPKAYANSSFLNAGQARLIRIMCELEEPKVRLEERGVENIVMFFGSARAKSRRDYEAAVQQAEAAVAEKPDDPELQRSLTRLQKQAFLVPMWEAVRDTARLLTEWSAERARSGLPKYHVGTGAGPGMMEAANKGATLAGGDSVGFGISLPWEPELNPYVTPTLGFEFHYFFTRKYWMAFKCMGLVVAPGGLGTCDELFEIMTLMQTRKIKRALPIVLIGKQFWQSCINWESFTEFGMISEQDANQLKFADTAEEAFQHLVTAIEKLEQDKEVGPPSKKEHKQHK